LTELQRLEKTLKDILDRLQKLENQTSKTSGAVSATSKSSMIKWNGGYVTNPTYFEALTQINDSWEELDGDDFLEKLYRTAANEPEDHPFEDRDAELRWWDNSTGNYINAFPFLLTMGEESTPWLLIDQALAVRKDFYALGMLTSGEGVLNLYGGVGWGPDGFDSNPFVWLAKGGDYGSKDYLEIRRTVGGDWGWGHLKCGDIYSNGTKIDVIAEKGSDATDGSGDCTVVFDEEFAEIPLVFLQAVDAVAKGIVLDVVSKSTTQFVVKARKVTGMPNQHTFSDSDSDSFNTDSKSAGTPSGSIGVPSGTINAAGPIHSHTVQAHNHNGITAWGFCTGGQGHQHGVDTENQSQTSGPDSGTVAPASGSHNHVFSGNALGNHYHSGSVTINISGSTSSNPVSAPVLAANFDWMAIPA